MVCCFSSYYETLGRFQKKIEPIHKIRKNEIKVVHYALTTMAILLLLPAKLLLHPLLKNNLSMPIQLSESAGH